VLPAGAVCAQEALGQFGLGKVDGAADDQHGKSVNGSGREWGCALALRSPALSSAGSESIRERPRIQLLTTANAAPTFPIFCATDLHAVAPMYEEHER
jgi:hypothetical protein